MTPATQCCKGILPTSQPLVASSCLLESEDHSESCLQRDPSLPSGALEKTAWFLRHCASDLPRPLTFALGVGMLCLSLSVLIGILSDLESLCTPTVSCLPAFPGTPVYLCVPHRYHYPSVPQHPTAVRYPCLARTPHPSALSVSY